MFVRLILLMVCGVAATHNKMVWVPKTTASNPTTTTPAPRMSNRALKKLSELMWTNKGNYFQEGVDYNTTNTATVGTNFFKENQLNEALLQSGTWPAFIRLLDNYNYETGVKETESDENTSEEDTFLDAIVDTVVMDKLWEGLLNAGLVTGNKDQELKNMLREYWFQTYSRFGNSLPDSSGFEHVFVGEIQNFSQNDASVIGLHNWMQFYLEEKGGSLNIFHQRRICQPTTREFEFTWHGVRKLDRKTKRNGLSTALFGVNSEFEVGLYTLCFLARPNQKCRVRYGSSNRTVKTFIKRGTPPSATKHVGTAYTMC